MRSSGPHAAGPAAASSSCYELLMDLLLCLLRPRRWPSALERQSRGLRKSLEADFSSVFGSNSGSMMKYTSTSLNSASSHSEVKAIVTRLVTRLVTSYPKPFRYFDLTARNGTYSTFRLQFPLHRCILRHL